MSNQPTTPSSDQARKVRSRRRAFTAVLIAFIGLAAAVAYWAGSSSVEKYAQSQGSTGVRGAHQPAPVPGNGYFSLEGDQYTLRSPAMIAYPFAAQKAEDGFRVFILGGSQAMGCPFVGDGLEFAEEDYFGTATWLELYLQELLPHKDVEVITAAMAGQDLDAIARLFEEIAVQGAADLVVIISGNNEAPPMEPGARPMNNEETRTIVAALADNFGSVLSQLVAVADRAAIPTYVLTVPSNLRDWAPVGPTESDHEQLRALLAQGQARQALEQLGDVSRNPIRQYLQARAFDQIGMLKEASGAYRRARERDADFRRARTAWNSLVLKRAQSTFVRAIDMEGLAAKYAKDGIPGFDLFVDNCHLNPRGHRIVALEIAKVFAAEGPGPAPEWLATVPSGATFASDKTFDEPRFAESALRALELAVQADPRSRVNPMVLGMLYAEQGRTREARLMFERAASTPSLWSEQVPFDELLQRQRDALGR